MKALRIWTSGARDIATLSMDECVSLSESATVAAIVDLAPSMNDYHVVYEDGVTRQVKVERHIIEQVVERIGRAQPFDRHLGHTS